jgi:hypothetical protein
VSVMATHRSLLYLVLIVITACNHLIRNGLTSTAVPHNSSFVTNPAGKTPM